MRRGIPEELHFPIIEYILTKFGETLVALASDPAVGNRLVVVKTQGTLRPGSKQDWLNEIHPTPAGFKKIYTKIYQEMRRIEPSLPS